MQQSYNKIQNNLQEFSKQLTMNPTVIEGHFPNQIVHICQKASKFNGSEMLGVFHTLVIPPHIYL